jgi:hypothetical protein
VLNTPVTSADKTLASCTANVPTPPAPVDGRSEFDFGLDLILDGLKRAAGTA